MVVSRPCSGSHTACTNHNEDETSVKKSRPLKGDKNNNEKESITERSSSARTASLTLEQLIKYESKYGREVDPSMDLTKLRKIISNRLSAQRCRNKKAQYIREMEKKVNDLQAAMSFLSPEIAHYEHKQSVLTVQKALLQQQLDSFTQKSILLTEEIEEMKLEVKRLKELHEAQRGQKFQPLEHEQGKEQVLQAVGIATKQENWGIEQYLNLELWGESIFNP